MPKDLILLHEKKKNVLQELAVRSPGVFFESPRPRKQRALEALDMVGEAVVSDLPPGVKDDIRAYMEGLPEVDLPTRYWGDYGLGRTVERSPLGGDIEYPPSSLLPEPKDPYARRMEGYKTWLRTKRMRRRGEVSL